MGEAVKIAKPPKVPKKTHLLVQVKRGERTVRSGASRSGRVRWGPTVGIEIPYPVLGVSTRETLFMADRRGARLLLRPGMTGVIHSGGSQLALEDLDAWGLVKGRGKSRHLLLTNQMFGWFEYRGLRVQFVFGPPPPKPPKVKERPVKVPLRLRRALIAREELPFMLLSLAMYVLLFALCVTLISMEVSRVVKRDDVDERFAKLIYEAPQAKTRIKQEIDARKKQEEEAAAPEEEVAEEEEPVAEEPVEEPEPEESTPEPEVAAEPEPEPVEPQQTAAERREAIRKEVSKKGLLGVLGGRGSASTARSSGSILEGSGKAADLDKVLENVKGLRGPAGGDDWSGKELDDASSGVDADAAAASAAGARVVELEGRADAEVESVDTGELDELTMKEAVAAIHRTVDTYLGGIRYLYNRELRQNPDLEGKVTIAITIEPDGSVTKAEVVETTMDAPDLTKAIIARVKRWTFPPVAPRTITVTYPFVFFPSM